MSTIRSALAEEIPSIWCSTCHQWFPCGPLLASHLTWFFPGLFLLCSRPGLLTKAAEGGLEPAPASRSRGANPHRSSSYTHWALLGPLRSWRTVVRVANKTMSPVLQRPVEFVEHEVAEQWREWSPLWGPFYAWADQPVLHHPSIQECPDEFQQPPVFDPFSDLTHQFVVMALVQTPKARPHCHNGGNDGSHCGPVQRATF